DSSSRVLAYRTCSSQTLGSTAGLVRPSPPVSVGMVSPTAFASTFTSSFRRDRIPPAALALEVGGCFTAVAVAMFVLAPGRACPTGGGPTLRDRVPDLRKWRSRRSGLVRVPGVGKWRVPL